jgi:hypothetical protein
LERADHDLGVEAGAQEELIACGESRPQELGGRRILGVGGVEEGDQDVGAGGEAGLTQDIDGDRCLMLARDRLIALRFYELVNAWRTSSCSAGSGRGIGDHVPADRLCSPFPGLSGEATIGIEPMYTALQAVA